MRQAGPVIEKLANRIADPEKPVREALKTLFHGSLVTTFSSGMLMPFLPLLMAHICSAMTHLQEGIRYQPQPCCPDCNLMPRCHEGLFFVKHRQHLDRVHGLTESSADRQMILADPKANAQHEWF